MGLQTLKDNCQEYFAKVVAIGKSMTAMNDDELNTCLEYAFRRRDVLEAERDDLDVEIGFSDYVIADLERRLAGHNESAAVFKLCKCEWCVNGWTPEKGRE